VLRHDWVRFTKQPTDCHVIEAVTGYVSAYRLGIYFVLGRKDKWQAEVRDPWRSWMFVKVHNHLGNNEPFRRKYLAGDHLRILDLGSRALKNQTSYRPFFNHADGNTSVRISKPAAMWMWYYRGRTLGNSAMKTLTPSFPGRRWNMSITLGNLWLRSPEF